LLLIGFCRNTKIELLTFETAKSQRYRKIESSFLGTMDELFNILSSSARIDKSKRKKKNKANVEKIPAEALDLESITSSKKDHSTSKLKHIHKEQINAFRNRVGIGLSHKNKHDDQIPDPISSFADLSPPGWWTDQKSFQSLQSSIVRNIESGRWINPTPIQMQAIPSLLSRRDILGCAPTGSGKSGAFIIPTLVLTSVSDAIFYKTGGTKAASKGKKGKNAAEKVTDGSSNKIRALLLAPSRELASQLHREVERLGEGKVGGIRSALLSKSNASTICANSSSSKSKGLDILVSTPLRLVECLKEEHSHGKQLDLGSVRIVVLDEADRLLDASDGKDAQSGSSHVKSFLEQVDTILSHVPSTAVRALFSATIGSSVRHLAESILRNEIDISTGMKNGNSTAAGVNHNVSQSLTFVGREEGKLLAIRQIIAKGLNPPVIIFMQSKDRAQALFLELMYDNIHVDVVHAGKSQAARDAAVARFRRGDTWVLICTDLCARGLDFKAVNMVINYDLPTSGVTYVHRIGRCGRAGRTGEAITLFTEQDFEHLRTIANIMKLSGCDVPDWMLTVKGSKRGNNNIPVKRKTIDTTPNYDKKKQRRKKQQIQASMKRKQSGSGK
jgi:ATP-dependent RNA helicase DDX52/ROK1